MLPWVTCSAALPLSFVKRAPRPWCLHASAAPDRAAWQAADSGIPPAQVAPLLPGHSGTAQLNSVPAGARGRQCQLEFQTLTSKLVVQSLYYRTAAASELSVRPLHVLSGVRALQQTNNLLHMSQPAGLAHVRQGRREAVREAHLRREPSAGAPARLKELPWRSRSSSWGVRRTSRCADSSAGGMRGCLVLVLHDGPVKHVVPLEACMHAWIRHVGACAGQRTEPLALVTHDNCGQTMNSLKTCKQGYKLSTGSQ